jgi:hypothetical protein
MSATDSILACQIFSFKYKFYIFLHFYTLFTAPTRQTVKQLPQYRQCYKLVDHVSFHLFGANSFWLLTASFVPLATRGIGQHSADFAFLLFYLIVLAFWDVAWIIMTAMVIKTSQRPLSAEEKKIPYRWALLYGLQIVIILLVSYLFPNLIPLAPLLMIVNVIYGFLSNKF